MVSVVFLSDLHTRDFDPPPADLLINCGDNTFRGKANEVLWYKRWLKNNRDKYKEIIWTNGNHDWYGDLWGPELAEETDTIYLENSGCEVLGLKIWGSPISPTFFDWYFMRDRGEDIAKVWAEIPMNLDILFVHTPAFGVFDTTPYDPGKHLGCVDLWERLQIVQPRYFSSGHFHDHQSTKEILWCSNIEKSKSTIFIAAPICDENYKARTTCIKLEIPVYEHN